VLNHYRRLIALRKAEPALVHGDYRLLMKDHAQIYAYQRRLDGERIAVIVNLSAKPARFDHPGVVLRHERLLLANPPFEARVYRLSPPRRQAQGRRNAQ
jgi:alpha-glucosidase